LQDAHDLAQFAESRFGAVIKRGQALFAKNLQQFLFGAKSAMFDKDPEDLRKMLARREPRLLGIAWHDALPGPA